MFLQNFAKNIFGLLQSLRAREEGRHKPTVPPSQTSAVGAAPQRPAPAVARPNPTPYSRYDQERFQGKSGWHTLLQNCSSCLI